MSSSGRKVPGGRSASGVARGRVTSSGTTFGWASASRAVVAGDGAQLGGPVGVGGVDVELGEDCLGDAVSSVGCAGGGAGRAERVPQAGEINGERACPGTWSRNGRIASRATRISRPT
jgi:hypothetical protein